jgi:hypothetical protein
MPVEAGAIGELQSGDGNRHCQGRSEMLSINGICPRSGYAPALIAGASGTRE